MCAQSCLTLHPMDCSCQAPLSMESSRQEYWSRLTFPPPGDLPDPRIELSSFTYPVLADRFFTAGLCINNHYGMFQIDQIIESHL